MEEQISEQSEGFDEQREGMLDPMLSVELGVDPITTSSTSTSPLHLLDDSVAKKSRCIFGNINPFKKNYLQLYYES